MKALGIAFSARERGNCLNCVEYVLMKLKERGFKTEAVNAYDYEIRPCSRCSYECFPLEVGAKTEDCPIQDDVPKIYNKMRGADVIVLAVPTYCGKPAGLYQAFSERALGAFKGYENFKRILLDQKIIALIVIGNVPAGGDVAYHIVILDHYNCRYPPPSLLLQPEEYNQSSLSGTLTAEPKIRERLDNLTNSIVKRWESKR